MLLNLPEYQISEVLHEGNETFIYRALRKEDNVYVIIKVLKEGSSLQHINQLRQEYEILQKLHIPQSIKAYGLEHYNDRPVLVLENFEGQPLSTLIKAQKLDVISILKISIALAQGLAELHNQHVIHKDIKPQNILVNENFEIKFIDFGIAKLLVRQVNQMVSSSEIQGTLTYMSPEQTGRINRPIDYRTDIYSLGVTLYEMATGCVPFQATNFIELIHCHLAREPTPPYHINKALPEPFSAVILKCLSKSADMRYHSAHGLKNDLEECLRIYTLKTSSISFVAGNKDVYDQFLLPQKLYGREHELSLLLSYFDKCREGNKEIFFINGPPGIGKTRLVQELQKRIEIKSTLFISGTFEKLNSHIPYSAILQAFRNLLQHLLTKSDIELSQWRDIFLQALGDNCSIIETVIPEIKLIIGDHPYLNIKEEENRFNIAFTAFIDVIIQKLPPLVLFLDNLQWADAPSLKLLQLILSDPARKKIFFLAAYRDKESEISPIFLSLLESVQQYGNVTTLFLAPLCQSAVTNLVRETFYNSVEEIHPLSHLIFQKTRGNPFFVTEFLKLLYQEQKVYFDSSRQSWLWDLDNIKNVLVTDNVAELMCISIQNLTYTTQSLLKIAALIGHTFSTKIIADVVGCTPTQVEEDLWEACLEELIILQPEGKHNDMWGTTFSFQHERIQNAVYLLLKDDERCFFHVKIGQSILRNTPSEFLDDYLIDIVNHLNCAPQLIVDPSEKIKYAELNLHAGNKAKAAAAYESALQCFSSGIKFLDKKTWDEHYELTLSLYENYALSELLAGDNTHVEKTFDLILEKAKTVLDKTKINCYKIVFYTQTIQFSKAIACGTEALKLFGVKTTDCKYIFMWQWLQLKANLFLLDFRKHHFLTKVRDKKIVALTKLYAMLLTPAYYSNMMFWRYLLARNFNLSMNRGLSEYSSLALASLAIFYATPPFREYKKTIRYCSLALKMADQFPGSKATLQVKVVWFSTIACWEVHIKEAIRHLKTIEYDCFTTGLLGQASKCLKYQSIYLLIKGECLSVTQKEIEKNLITLQNYKNNIEKNLVSFLWHICSAFQELNFLSTDQYLQQWNTLLHQSEHKELAPAFTLFYGALGSMVFFLKGSSQSVADLSEIIEPLSASFSAHPLWVIYYFFQALAAADLAKTSLGKRKVGHLLDKYGAIFAKLATIFPTNCQHKYLLIKAEMARLYGKKYEASQLYEKAISGAREVEYFHDEALAYELAAKFYLAEDNQKLACLHMNEACQLYIHWGATAKVNLIKNEYKQLLQMSKHFKSMPSRHFRKGWTTYFTPAQWSFSPASYTIESPESDVDIGAIMQASHAISSEIVLDKLLSKLMHIALISAGANRAFLILKEGDELVVQAEIEAGQDTPTLFASVPVQKMDQLLCLAIVHYVARSKKDVLLGNATREGNFTKDHYILTNKVPSVLCLPLINRGKLTGILYLENRLSQDAFTPERLLVLELLSAQIASSVENALFYSNLENKIEDRTIKLKDKNKELQENLQKIKIMQSQLVEREKMASLGALTADIAQEINTPLSQLITSANLSSEMLLKIKEMITLFGKQQGMPVEINNSFKQLKAHLEVVTKEGLKADAILKKMLSHTPNGRQDGQDRRTGWTG